MTRLLINVATLATGAVVGAFAVAFWGSQQPTTILAISTLDATSVAEPFVIPVVVWMVGIGAGLLFAATVLKYYRRI